MEPTTLLGTLVLLTTWSSVGATEAYTYSFQKADNCIEQRIAAARSDDGWSLLLKPELKKPMPPLPGKRPRHQVVTCLAEQEGISVRSARRYVSKAEEQLIASISESDCTALLAQLISTLQDTTRRAVATERFSEVIGCCRLLGQLTGLLERNSST